MHLFEQQDGSLERLARESELLEQAYGHYFDLKIINNDIEDTIRTLEQAIEEVRYFTTLLVTCKVTLAVAFGFLRPKFWEGGWDLQVVLCQSVNAG